MNPLKKWREARDLSQGAAAELVGCKQQSWSKYENGRIPTDRDLMRRITEVTGVTANDFYEVDDGQTADAA